MNRVQRIAVGFLIFALAVGGVTAPAHGTTHTTGLLVGLVVYLLFAVVAVLIHWMVDGLDGVKHHFLMLIGKRDRPYSRL